MPNLIGGAKSLYDPSFFWSRTNRIPTRDCSRFFKSCSDFRLLAGSLLEFVRYESSSRSSTSTMPQRGMTYAAPLKVTPAADRVRRSIPTRRPSPSRTSRSRTCTHGRHALHDVDGTFVVNGTERVIVSQMPSSPGVFFDHDKGKSHSSCKLLFAARSFLSRLLARHRVDAKTSVYARIDRTPQDSDVAAVALGLDGEEILSTFYRPFRTRWTATVAHAGSTPSASRAQGGRDIIDADTARYSRIRKKLACRRAPTRREEREAIKVPAEELYGQYLAQDLFDPSTGEIFAGGEEITIKDPAAADRKGL